MSVIVSVGKHHYESTTKNKHAEEVMFATDKYNSGNLTVEMNAWPCTHEKYHDCYELFTNQSVGRIITVTVTADTGGYAKSHGKNYGATGTITYNNGVATIT